jgi:hypothetical protein
MENVNSRLLWGKKKRKGNYLHNVRQINALQRAGSRGKITSMTRSWEEVFHDTSQKQEARRGKLQCTQPILLSILFCGLL